MRNRLAIIIVFMFALLLNSCSDSSTNPTPSDEFLEAKINGVKWIGDVNSPPIALPGFPPVPTVWKVYDGLLLTMLIPRKTEPFALPQRMMLDAARQFTGEITLVRASVSYPMERIMPNPPMPIIITSIRSFELESDSQNVLRITRLDTAQRIIEGEFRFRARETITRLDSLDQFGLPITVLGDSVITVTDGRFRIKYETELRYFQP